MTAAQEREAVVRWLRWHADATGRDVEKMFWGARYGRLFVKALNAAADAIERGQHIEAGEHIKETSE